jgi:hypothetical protein
LIVDARDIWVGDQALFPQLLADRNFTGRNISLLAPSTFAPLGYLEGSNVVLRPATSLFVRNSGTVRAFAGITVGNSLTIVGGANGVPADVVAFGRRTSAAGDIVGFPFFFQVNFGGSFTDRAEFNTCIINPRFCPGGSLGVDPDPDAPFDPDGDGVPNLPPRVGIQDLVSEAALTEPLIEEPVTSGGDSSAWIEDDEEDEEEEEEEVVPPIVVTPARTGGQQR